MLFTSSLLTEYLSYRVNNHHFSISEIRTFSIYPVVFNFGEHTLTKESEQSVVVIMRDERIMSKLLASKLKFVFGCGSSSTILVSR